MKVTTKENDHGETVYTLVNPYQGLYTQIKQNKSEESHDL